MAKGMIRAALAAVTAAIVALGLGEALLGAESTPSPKASGAESSEPENTTATYGDWVLHCVRAQNSARVCEAQQTLEVKGQGVVAQIAVGRADPKGPLLATLVLPTNISFPSTAALAVDEKDDQPLELAWKQCVPGGCVAQTELKEDVFKRWRAQTGHGQIRFVNAAKQPLSFAFSFRGFVSAIDNLGKPAPAQ